MRIINTILIGLNIDDCIGAFSSDDIILQIVKSKYELKCYMGMFIETVNSIKVSGDCIINQFGSPSFGTMSLICDVTGIIYTPNEVITGCVVKNKDKSGIMICEANNTSIMIKHNTLFESVNIGQVILARVGRSKYCPSSSHISVNAVPFLPNYKATVYTLGPITDDDLALLSNTLQQITDEESLTAEVKKTNNSGWNFFAQLLYPFKEKTTPSPTREIVDLFKKSSTTVYISRDPRLDLSNPLVTVVDYNESVDTVTPPAGVVMAVANDYINHLRLIREMIMTYDTDAKLKAHTNLWQIYKKHRQ